MSDAVALDPRAEWLERVLGLKIARPATDGLAEFNKRLTALMPQVKAATAQRPDGQDLRAKLSEAGVFARKQDFAAAHACLDAAEALLARPPGPGVADEEQPQVRPVPRGMAEWQAARATALATLKALEAEVRQMEVEEGPEAVILLRAIQANLTAQPETPQQVAELQRYLETDDIIAEAEEPNGFGITVSLRAPLLAALAGLRQS